MRIRYFMHACFAGLTACLVLFSHGAGAQSAAGDAERQISQAGGLGGAKPPQSLPRKVQPPPDPKPRESANGGQRGYPKVGQRVATLPQQAALIAKDGVNYWYARGVWYARQGEGYVVVRPPVGISVPDLPRGHTPVLVGSLIYYYANGVYYRANASGGYDVVPEPSRVLGSANGDDPARRSVTPRYGQSAERQSVDEDECHRWALEQSRLDATGTLDEKKSEALRRSDYLKAQASCLLARGYEVR